MVSLLREPISQNFSFEPKMFNKFHKNLVKETIESLPFSKPKEKKLLIIDSELMRVMNFLKVRKERLFDDYNELKQNTQIESKYYNIVYIIKPCISTCRIIEKQVECALKNKIEHEYFVIFVPNYSIECNNEFEQSLINQYLNIGEMRVDFLCLENDLISLEDNSSFEKLILDGDYSILTQIIRVIKRIEKEYGKIPYKYAKGEWASFLWDKLQSEKDTLLECPESEIKWMIMLDRSIDLYTPLCFQITYEGCIDEYFGINSTKLETEIKYKDNKNQSIKLFLTNKETVFKEIRDKLIYQLAEFFEQKTNLIIEYQRRIKENQTLSGLGRLGMQISDKKIINEKPFLDFHSEIVENISNYFTSFQEALLTRLEQSIIQNDTKIDPLELIKQYSIESSYKNRVNRLLLLLLLSRRIEKNKLKESLKFLIGSFGIEESIMMQNFTKKILNYYENDPPWPNLKKDLNLIRSDNSDIKNLNLNDLSYIYKGYIPLFPRYVELILTKGFSNPDLKKVKGPERMPKSAPIKLENSKKNNIIILIIGGITFAEMATFRALSLKFPLLNFLIITTQMINGNKLVKSFLGGISNEINNESFEAN